MKSVLTSIAWGSLGMAIALVPVLAVQLETQAQSQLTVLAQAGDVQTDGAFDLTFEAQRIVSGPPPGGRSQGGGSRSGDTAAVCPVPEVPLTALVPFEATYKGNKATTVDVWGYTTAAHPTFWAYMPYTNPAIPVTFTLEDDTTGDSIYSVDLTPPAQPGLISVTVPDARPALQPGRQYRWTLGLKCKSANQTEGSTAAIETIYVQAVVVRSPLESAIAGQLTPKPSLKNASLYAKHGFWYDALNTLAILRRQSPHNATLDTAWKTLLSGMVLSDKSKEFFNVSAVADQPFAQ